MPFHDFFQELMAQSSVGDNDDRASVVVHVHGPVTINVNPPQPVQAPTPEGVGFMVNHVFPGGFGSQDWLHTEKQERRTGAAQSDVDPEAKVPSDGSWQTPEAADRLRSEMEEKAGKPAGFDGSLTKEELMRLATKYGFSVQTAQRLYGFLTGQRLAEYLALKDTSLQIGDNGGFRKGDLKKVWPLLDPNSDDKLLHGYGEEQHGLLRAVSYAYARR